MTISKMYGTAVEKLCNFLDSHPMPVACVGPLLLNSDGTRQSYGFPEASVLAIILQISGIYKILPAFIGKILCPGCPTRTPTCRRVFWIVGACMLFRTAVFHELGGLNEEIKFYGEEVEIAYRLFRRKYETWCYPDCVMVHLGGKSTIEPVKKQLAQDEDVRWKEYIEMTSGVDSTKKMLNVAILLWKIRAVFTFLVDRNKYLTINRLIIEKRKKFWKEIRNSDDIYNTMKKYKNRTTIVKKVKSNIPDRIKAKIKILKHNRRK